MPCSSCGGKVKRIEVLRTARSVPTRNGGYSLASYPDCTELHVGAYLGNSLYVVGRNTEFERLFKRTDLSIASDYAREVKQSIENLPTSALCDAAVLAVYG